MSLINKVLQEIDKREEKKDQSQHDNLKIVFAQTKKSTLTIKYLFAVVLLLLLIISLFSLFHTKHKKSATTNVNQTVAQKSASTQSTPTQKPQQPVFIKLPQLPPSIILSNVKVNVEKDRTMLDFIISKPIYYYLEHNDDQQQLTLRLNNVTLSGNYGINTHNTAIKSISFKQEKTNVIVTIMLVPDTQIIGLQLYTTPQPHIQLVLLNSNVQPGNIRKNFLPRSSESLSYEKYQNAGKFIAENKNTSAISELSSALDNNPEDTKIREMLASLLIKKEQYSQANKILATGLELKPDYYPFSQLQAYSYAKQGKIETAINILEKNPPNLIEAPQYYGFLANMYLRHGNITSAEKIYDQLTKIQPSNGLWWVGLGSSLESANHQNAAEIAYKRALTIETLPPEVRSFLLGKLQND